MVKIKIITIGKMSLDFKKILYHYNKKIKMFSNFTIVELKEFNDKNIKVQKHKETQNILKHLKPTENHFLLSLKGTSSTSLEFSELVKKDITFVIGGSHGVEEKYFPRKISFSKLTFPHQICRILLFEQIYRGLSILKNMKYHK